MLEKISLVQLAAILSLILWFVVVNLFLKLRKERREREDIIADRLKKEKEISFKEGRVQEHDDLQAELAQARSRPINPRHLPCGRYTVLHIFEEESCFLWASATRRFSLNGVINGKAVVEPKIDGWFIELPQNRARTLPVPFDIVVDGNGMCYEPVKISVVPKDPPEGEAETAA